MNVKEKLLEVINEALQIPPDGVMDDEKFANYPDFDSFGFMMFVMELERAFEIVLTNDEIIEMVSVSTAIIIIERKVNN